MKPERDGLHHKRNFPTKAVPPGNNPRTVCGGYGYIVAMWPGVTCLACLDMRKQK